MESPFFDFPVITRFQRTMFPKHLGFSLPLRFGVFSIHADSQELPCGVSHFAEDGGSIKEFPTGYIKDNVWLWRAAEDVGVFSHPSHQTAGHNAKTISPKKEDPLATVA